MGRDSDVNHIPAKAQNLKILVDYRQEKYFFENFKGLSFANVISTYLLK